MTDKAIVKVDNLVVSVKNDDKGFDINYSSFDVNVGDFMLVKGRNGCGKSTFLRLFHLQGVNYFDIKSGSIKFIDDRFPEDKSIHQYSSEELTRLNCLISYIGQEDNFLTADSAYSYIYNACKYSIACDKNLSIKEKRNRLNDVDNEIKSYYDKYLSDSFKCKNYKTFKNKNARGWSGGQQKMINILAGIIKAKVCGLKLIVMDEPLNNLDGKNKFIVSELIADLRANQDIAIIAITHCQVFKGVNKVLDLVEEESGARSANLSLAAPNSHTECLEDYKKNNQK